jgi:uncharacterized protein YbcI
MTQSQQSRHDRRDDPDGQLGAAISDAMVAIVREAIGRGPTRTRTFIHDDVIVCLLHETMTPLERTLHQQHREDTVDDVRDVLHSALAPKAQQLVQELTGRTVVATLADHHRDPDAGVFVFLLQPRGD